MSLYIQIGAGAGDLDSRANFRDGFTELVKSHKFSPEDLVVLVEPNPVNLPFLLEAWASFNFKVHNLGIVPSRLASNSLNFYYVDEDAPHFQVTSLDPVHVLKHYPEGKLKSFNVKCETLPNFLLDMNALGHIELLSIDVEGVDAELILDVEWSKFSCTKISFEDHHMTPRQKAYVDRHLRNHGYIHCGSGVDFNDLDVLYVKCEGQLTRWRCIYKRKNTVTSLFNFGRACKKVGLTLTQHFSR